MMSFDRLTMSFDRLTMLSKAEELSIIEAVSMSRTSLRLRLEVKGSRLFWTLAPAPWTLNYEP